MKIKIILVTVSTLICLISLGIVAKTKRVEGKDELNSLVEVKNYDAKYNKEKNDGYKLIKKVYKIGEKSVFEDLNLYNLIDLEIQEELLKELDKFEKEKKLENEYIYRFISEPIQYGDFMVLSLGRFENIQSLEEDTQVLRVVESISAIVNMNKTIQISIEGTDRYYEEIWLLPEELISNESKELIVKYKK